MQVERLGRLLIRMRRVESPLTMDLIYKSILQSVRTLLKKARSPSFCSIKPALSLWHREVYIISPEEAWHNGISRRFTLLSEPMRKID